MKTSLDFEAPIVEMEKMLDELKKIAVKGKGDFSDQISELEKKLENTKRDVYSSLTPWQTVKIARHPKRPIFEDYIKMIFTDFVELHGDRKFSDDKGMKGGFAKLGKTPVMLLGHNKGKNVTENVERNFGMATPDGYRKALRLMRLAEKFNTPIITFIDTAGAFPGLEAEERGQAEAIARNLTEMAKLTVPIVVIVTGEGGSGGALGIGVGDSILMLSHSVYSVISPEGCASILWRDAKYAETAAEALKITAPSLVELGVVDEVIEEPIGGAHNDYESTAVAVKQVLRKHITKLSKYSESKLLNSRFKKYSNIGIFNK